jgi:hypothetical protein
MQVMNTNLLTPSATNARPKGLPLARVLLALVLGSAGIAHAEDVPPATAPAAAPAAPAAAPAARPLDLTLRRDPMTRPGALTVPREDRADTLPYGSGYESRHLNAGKDSASAAGGHGGGAATSDTRGPKNGAAGGGSRNGSGRHGRR